MNSSKLFVLLSAFGALAGCYESPDITLHEPHQYKGVADPLIERQRSDEQPDRLRKRFAQVQTDR